MDLDLRQRCIVALTVATLPFAAGAVAAPVSAATAPCRVVNARTAAVTSKLQVALDAAAANDTLRITGTCTGSFTVGTGYPSGRRLTLAKGRTAATLRGDNGRVLTVDAGTISLVGLRITGGIGYACPSGGPADGCGGGIWNAARLKLTGVKVDGNQSEGSAVTMHDGGGIYNATGGVLTLVRSTVSGNSAAIGGGIRNTVGGVVHLVRSTISGNTATYATISVARGGGIFNEGTLTLDRSLVAGNTASSPVEGSGGGIYSTGPSSTLSLVRSTVSGNTASGAAAVSGGGLTLTDSGTATITRSTISGNHANDNGVGGGISSEPGLTITASTISGNTAGLQYGAIGAGGPLRLVGSTVTKNSAPNMGGVAADDTLELRSTIVAGNRTTVPANGGRDCAATSGKTSGDHSLIGDGTDCGDFADGVSFNRVGTGANPVAPKLGPLAKNGGPTRTHAVLAGSPALNAAGKKPCATTTDQRGVARPRPAGGRCDIGAFER